jgi:hypothetical protein
MTRLSQFLLLKVIILKAPGLVCQLSGVGQEVIVGAKSYGK